MPPVNDEDRAIEAMSEWAGAWLVARNWTPSLAHLVATFAAEVLRRLHGDDWPALVLAGRVEREDRRPPPAD